MKKINYYRVPTMTSHEFIKTRHFSIHFLIRVVNLMRKLGLRSPREIRGIDVSNSSKRLMCLLEK